MNEVEIIMEYTNYNIANDYGSIKILSMFAFIISIVPCTMSRINFSKEIGASFFEFGSRLYISLLLMSFILFYWSFLYPDSYGASDGDFSGPLVPPVLNFLIPMISVTIFYFVCEIIYATLHATGLKIFRPVR
jgi:hypothetical protein